MEGTHAFDSSVNQIAVTFRHRLLGCGSGRCCNLFVLYELMVGNLIPVRLLLTPMMVHYCFYVNPHSCSLLSAR